MKNLVFASKLVNSYINELCDLYGSVPTMQNSLLRVIPNCCNSYFAIQPTYGKALHGVGHILRIVEACNCHSYIGLEKNEKGDLVPTLYVF